jgi:hypothetical protein
MPKRLGDRPMITITTRLYDTEKESVAAAARSMGISPCSFVRQAIIKQLLDLQIQ